VLLAYTQIVPPAFHIENFGCRAARADGEAIAAQLEAAGCEAEPAVEADIVIVNTCSVTAEADREARAYIRRVHRRSPQARILVTGCYAQRAPQELAAIPGVAAVVGNSHKALVPQIALAHAAPLIQIQPVQPAPLAISQQQDSQAAQAASAALQVPSAAPQLPQVYADDSFAHSFLEEAQVLPGAQTRPNLKIQEGCGNRCTFCVIPQTRGNSRSLPFAKVLAQVEGFVAAGGNELVLSGINLGRWGRDLAPSSDEPRSLAALVRTLIEQTDLPRLRLSSIEPMDWDDALIALLGEFGGSRLCRHAHLPLQSGSDTVLRRMHRRYRPWHYAQKVESLIAAAGPELTLGADVMVGFPGETDAEFDETVAFVRALPFGYLHLFPFSPRPGTPGWELHKRQAVPERIVHQRMDLLRDLAAEKAYDHRTRLLGREVAAVTLNTPLALTVDGLTLALSDNFIPVVIHGSLPPNWMVRILADALNDDGALAASSFTRDLLAAPLAVAV
jgi:threonylcarbamoyladenosine tRNA methylthiotransferase MtaB